VRIRPKACLISGYYSSHFAAGFWLMRLVGTIPYGMITYGLDMSLPEPRFVEPIKRFLLSQADVVITISEASKRKVLSLGASEGQTKLLFPSVDATVFSPTDATGLRRRLGLDGKRVVLTVGRLVPRKGHKMVLKAVATLRDKTPDLVYVIVGEGPNRGALMGLTNDLQLQDRVVFAGFVPDDVLPEYYSLCDVFVMPSYEVRPGDYEGFGIVYLEANACGKPVIGGRHGGTVDAVVHGKTGLLVDPSSVEEIASAIGRLLGDDGLARRLGNNGRRRVEREFTCETAAATLQQALCRVVA
jgi:phosphatidylinositol alpha-1,6-mannosyltransferase